VAVSDVRKGSEAELFGCTACTVSHLPRARVAAESWRQHHPESPFFVLLIDGREWPREREQFQIVLPEELGLSADELAVRLGIYDAYEMSIALKAHLFGTLLDQGATAVLFTDPDVCFYNRVDGLAEAARTAGLVLIPHAARPIRIQARGYFPLGQIEYRRTTNGLFNGGLEAVGSPGRDFLNWWDGWLARDCLRESSAGIWTDQSWLDWAPTYFRYVIVRDSSLDVAFWNLDERELHEVEGRPMVDGRPLRHFHFAGFDPQQPERLTTYLGDASALPQNPVVTKLLRQYGERLTKAGNEELSERPYGHAVSAGGRHLDRRDRAIYREAVLAASALGTDRPPNPFDPSRIDEFERLVNDPASLRALSPEARLRLERLRKPGVSLSSLGRIGKRLRPALRYARTEQPPPSLAIQGRVASDMVRLEYRATRAEVDRT
jgi:hypothetical protein